MSLGLQALLLGVFYVVSLHDIWDPIVAAHMAGFW